MKQVIYGIQTNKKIADRVFEMVLSGDTSEITRPGQFVNILVEGKYLRRPISVCDCSPSRLVLIYKIAGEGTEILSGMKNGAKLDVLTGLGNGYNISVRTEKPLLIGGGAGVPPMFNLCRRLINAGKDVSVILGFNTEAEVFYESEFKALGASVYVATADGSRGEKGFVTDVMKKLDYDYFFTCGPMPMFRAVNDIAVTDGQFSFEERMGCGFGACMGCSCKTKYGSKRICKDGPVLFREEIVW